MKNIRILIVDDHPLMRRALVAAIESEPDMQVVGTAVNGTQARAVFLEFQPDVVLMDLLMPDESGLEAITAICAEHPEARVLVVTSVEEDAEILKAIQAGAKGYITKTTETENLLTAIRNVFAGQSFLPPALATKLMASVRRSASAEDELSNETLTAREMEVVALVGQGFSNRQIAAALHITLSTVNVHFHNIMNKLGMENRRQVELYAVQQQDS
jgi:DNA-binding NarL/FixJ family response regulator